jgi:hypothetical protein
MWVAGGANWFFGRPPQGWNPWQQLIDGGYLELVPPFSSKVEFRANAPLLARLNLRESEDLWVLSASNA